MSIYGADSDSESLSLPGYRASPRSSEHPDEEAAPRQLSVVYLIVVLAGHAVALVQTIVLSVPAFVPSQWVAQQQGLLVFSFVLGLAGALTPRSLTGKLLFWVQIVVYLIISYGQGPSLWLRLTLLATLLYQASCLFVGFLPLAVVMGALILTLLLPVQPVRAWTTVLALPGAIDRFSSGALLAALSGALVAVKHFHRRAESFRRIAEQREGAVLRLTSANIEFQDYAFHVRDESMEIERHRIARDLHDGIGYTLTNLMMMMEASQDLISPQQERLGAILRSARDHAQEGIAEMRRTLRELRAIEPRPPACIPAIAQLSSGFQNATGVSVRVDYRNLPWSLAPDITGILCRMVQEGLTNAFRHGKATEVVLGFWHRTDGIQVTIQDNGIGSKDIKEGIGIQGMKERIEPRGGWVSIEGLSVGTKVSAWLPHPPEISSEPTAE
jgi:signal transduction histidine kinase